MLIEGSQVIFSKCNIIFLSLKIIFVLVNNADTARVVNLGTTTKLYERNFVPKPHPGHVVVVSRPKIG